MTPLADGRPVLGHLVEGTGTPCLLLNGGLMSIRAWDPVAAGLVARHRVIRCDLRGQLLSPGPVPSTFDEHADEVVRLLDALGVDRVHVAGTSLGAFVGITLAARRADRVRSLVAMTATDRITADDWQEALPFREAARDAAAGGDGGRVFDMLAPATFSDGYQARFAAELAQRRAVVASLPREWFVALNALLAPLEALDMRPAAARVSCPVLVVGGEHDRTFPLAHSHALCVAFPSARLHVVAGGAHGLVVEQPDDVVAILTQFWSGIDPDA